MSLAEKLTNKIMELVRLETVTIFAGITGRDMVANCTELGQAIAETKRLVNKKLLHRLDFNDGWLEFLNLPEYDAATTETDAKLLFKAAASGYELGYLEGWQDRDGLISGLQQEQQNERQETLKKRMRRKNKKPCTAPTVTGQAFKHPPKNI